MKSASFITGAFAVGLMVSPESLVLFGHSAGLTGYAFPAALLCAAGVVLCTAWTYTRLMNDRDGGGGEALAIQSALGILPALLFSLVPRVLGAVCLSASLAVTAGFVFNEVFVYWFPNFAFAFLLLGFLVFINLLGGRLAERAQVAFAGIAFAGLTALILAWIVAPSQAPPASGDISPYNAKALFSVLLVFVGFDLAFLAEVKAERASCSFRDVCVAIAGAVVLYCAWGMVSLLTVPRDALIDSTIPHMRVARTILGQEGRVVMGLVVIAGACSAVNVLLRGVSQMVVGMARQGILPSLLSVGGERGFIPLLAVGGGAAVLMAKGLAGEPVLEVAIRSAFLFWLITYAAMHLTALVVQHKGGKGFPGSSPAGHPSLSILSFAVLAGSSAWMLWVDERSAETICFMGVVSVVALVPCLIWMAVKRSGRA